MHNRYVLPYIFSLLLLIPSVSYSKVLPPAHAFTPFATASEFSSGKAYSLDSDGVLLYDYGSRYGNLGKFHNPTFIAAYANALYRDFLEGDRASKKLFLEQVDYLVHHAKTDVSGMYWVFPFRNEHYLAPVNWYSAMTSGRILGLLVRAHAVTDDGSYLTVAKKVLGKLSRARKLGGMTTYGNGSAWFEEVAYPDSKSFKVLNGHIFCLAGLYDYAQYTKNEDAVKLVQKGIKAIEMSLASFDAGFLSYYSEKSPAKNNRSFAERGGYNVIHIQQLLWLYEITNNSYFLEKALTFQFYESSYPEIMASHSTNSETHGPEKMNLKFGTNYWSSYAFPVQIVLDLKRNDILRGIVVLGHTLESTPRSFYVESSLDGEDWIGLAKVVGNIQQRRKILFTYLVKARYMRIIVAEDNGNGAVALDGIGLLREGASSPIVNFSNYSVGLRKLFDGDKTTGIKLKKSGWILLPNVKEESIIVYGNFNPAEFNDKTLYIEGSNNLKRWFKLNGRWSINDTKAIFSHSHKTYTYYRISFSDQFASRFNEIEYQ